MQKKKKKRRLKRWVRVVLWSMSIALTAWILCWPVKVLNEYWGDNEDMLNDTSAIAVDTVVSIRHTQDSAMQARLNRFVTSPCRLDTSDIALCVWNLNTDAPVMQWHAEELMVPASSLKLLTVISALKRLGAEHCYTERVMITGNVHNGVLHGDAILQVDDNPMVENLDEYIRVIRNKGIRKIDGHMIINVMRADTLTAHHTASAWDMPYHKIPVLLKGAPRIAQEVRSLMRQMGIESEKPLVEHGLKVYPVSHTLYTKSTPLTEVIAPMLIHSCNVKADALHYHTSHYADRYADIVGKGEDELDVFLRENLNYDTSRLTLNDGSGLSPKNMVDANFLVALLRYAWREPEIMSVLINEALATPGHSERRGSLSSRMRDPIYEKRIFCKTGTLVSIGASSLSGYAHSRHGDWYAFVVINRDSPVGESRLYQDMLCKVLVE